MNKNSKKLALYIFLTFLVALVAIVLRTVACGQPYLIKSQNPLLSDAIAT